LGWRSAVCGPPRRISDPRQVAAVRWQRERVPALATLTFRDELLAVEAAMAGQGIAIVTT